MCKLIQKLTLCLLPKLFCLGSGSSKKSFCICGGETATREALGGTAICVGAELMVTFWFLYFKLKITETKEKKQVIKQFYRAKFNTSLHPKKIGRPNRTMSGVPC